MSNNQLPADVQERIKADAEAATNKEADRLRETTQAYDRMISQLHGYDTGYIAGATAEAIRTADEIDKALHAERNKMQLKFSEADKQWADLLKQREDRAQVLVDALEWIQMHAPIEPIVDDVISNALQQWKEGKENFIESVNALRKATGCAKELADKAVRFSNNFEDQINYVKTNGPKF